MLKYSPYSVPHSTFASLQLKFLHFRSHSHSRSLDKYVDFFTRLLPMRPPLCINFFNMILGVLAKRNDFPTVLPRVQLLEARFPHRPTPCSAVGSPGISV
ncbi:hypothetical protein AHAS_Ahas15G0320900 [Arachis hypogaea]